MRVFCAQLCKASYDDSDPRFVSFRDMRFGVVREGGASVICFRGTANMSNAWRDVLTLPARTKRGYLAHRGFVEAAEELFDPVMEHIARFYSKEMIVTGHSFGGALALLFAEALGAKAVTFGCPRVYYRFAASPQLIEHDRYVCDDDPVTMIPHLVCEHKRSNLFLLRDGDYEIVNVKDHSINTYLSRVSCAA